MGRRLFLTDEYLRVETLENPRYCQQCGEFLIRKRWPSSVEKLKIFRRRKFCGRHCSQTWHKGKPQKIKKYPNEPEGMKTCGRCLLVKPLSCFATCPTSRLGVYNYCKDCAIMYQDEKNPQRVENKKEARERLDLFVLGYKICSKCKQTKVLSEFYRDLRHADGKQAWCRSCCRGLSNKTYLRSEYGLSPEDFQNLVETQNGLCALCGLSPKNGRFNIDHCHAAHFIRGLLCTNCNTNLLPYIEYKPDVVEKAFEYLRNPPAFALIGKKEVPESNQSRKRPEKRITRRPYDTPNLNALNSEEVYHLSETSRVVAVQDQQIRTS